jgi:hypothetical protein
MAVAVVAGRSYMHIARAMYWHYKGRASATVTMLGHLLHQR